MGTAGEEMKVPFVKNSGLSKALSFKHGAGQNIALLASPTARFSTFLVSVFLDHSTSFSQGFFFPTCKATCHELERR